MVSSVAHITQQIPVLIASHAAVLTTLALLALPAASDSFGDLDMGPGVEIVLATGGTVEQIAQLGWRDFGHFPNLPLVTSVV